jgi:hypothetical protein
MLTDRIIGRVGANILAKRISNPGQPGDSAALFRLDKLSSNQIAAVARAILANPDLLAGVDLMIPKALVDGQDLPPEILISHNAGYVRNNAATAKAAILTANGNEHNLADTLGHVMAIGAKEMRGDPEPWVEATLHAGGLSPVPDDRLVFHAALGGLLASSELSLVQLGEFCAEILGAMSTRGLAIRDAVGFALPRAGLPRDIDAYSVSRACATSIQAMTSAAEAILAGQHRAELLLRRPRWRSVVVREVEMGDATVEGAAHDLPGFLVVIHVAEVVPEAEGDLGEEDAGVAAASVVHGLNSHTSTFNFQGRRALSGNQM